jgi:hypothetical protein
LVDIMMNRSIDDDFLTPFAKIALETSELL